MISHSFIAKHIMRRSILSAALYPLSLVYRAAQYLHRGIAGLNAYQAPVKVISVGNICSGGSGKTPFTIALAKALRDMGIHCAVSHRGYKGSGEHSPQLISDQDNLLCANAVCGDEAFMLAQALPGIPVVAGKSRKEAIQLLTCSFPDLDVVIMDDAFQHVKVRRDVDIVCFDSLTGVGNGWLIPAGYLREPLTSLRHAHYCVINHKHDDMQSSQVLSKLLSRYHADVRHSVSGGKCLRDTQNRNVVIDKNDLCVLLSGIANPASLEQSVMEMGIRFDRHYCFADHHPFTSSTEIAEVLTYCKQYGIRHIICTAKDMPKLAVHPELHDMLRCLELILQDSENGKLWRDIARSVGYA